jgi:CRISPR-associated protein Cas1
MIDREPESPQYIPARMLNEFVYCPRLFFYEYVEGLFAHNQETIEGSLRHAAHDQRQDPLPTADALRQSTETIHARSVTLASDRYGVIAKIDLVEASGHHVTPVDYKRGSPRQVQDTLEPWEPEKVQLAIQALVLRENGYLCTEGIIFYWATRQRVRVPIDERLLQRALELVERARELVRKGTIPPPLVNSPKCPRCSLVGICLPDETNVCSHAIVPESQHGASAGEAQVRQVVPIENLSTPPDVRRLVPVRDECRALYLSTQGLTVGKNGDVLCVKDGTNLVQEVRLNDLCQINVFGNIQLSTQVIQAACYKEIPIAYFSQGGWFYGMVVGLGLKNIFLRQQQFRRADAPNFCLEIARALVAGKIRNQRTLLQRNHIEPPSHAIAGLKALATQAERAQSLPELLGIEGNAARTYFEHFSGMIKVGQNERNSNSSDSGAQDRNLPHGESGLTFDFSHRNRRPPRDPINALLSLGYSLLTKDLAIICQMVGFDPFMGFYHQLRFGRPALALDLMEPFRPLIVDSAVLTAVNTRMVTERDFIRAGDSVALSASGRKAFFRAYEQRMDTLVTHPLFGYRVSYRRMLEIQTRLLARVVTEELRSYPVFMTR